MLLSLRGGGGRGAFALLQLARGALAARPSCACGASALSTSGRPEGDAIRSPLPAGGRGGSASLPLEDGLRSPLQTRGLHAGWAARAAAANPPPGGPTAPPPRGPVTAKAPAAGQPVAKPKPKGEGRIRVTFIDKDGEETTVQAEVGKSLLEVAHENDVELEGACEGSLACSTCHVILEPSVYAKLEEPSDDENDMLDLAFGLTETSRLGCQVIASPELEGIRVSLPAATRNMAVDGFKPKPH